MTSRSKELLNIDFGQGAAKISEVKVGGRKKIAYSAWFEPMSLGSAGFKTNTLIRRDAPADSFSTSKFDL